VVVKNVPGPEEMLGNGGQRGDSYRKSFPVSTYTNGSNG
jgi:hypothetical protein